ncbi:MAG: hypothetical protein ACLTBV_07225 [Enterocloster bolteae]
MVSLDSIMDTVMTGVIPDEDTAAITDCIERGVKEVWEPSSYSFPWESSGMGFLRRWLSAIKNVD